MGYQVLYAEKDGSKPTLLARTITKQAAERVRVEELKRLTKRGDIDPDIIIQEDIRQRY